MCFCPAFAGTLAPPRRGGALLGARPFLVPTFQLGHLARKGLATSGFRLAKSVSAEGSTLATGRELKVTGQYQSEVSVLANGGLVLTAMANLGKQGLVSGMVCPLDRIFRIKDEGFGEAVDASDFLYVINSR